MAKVLPLHKAYCLYPLLPRLLTAAQLKYHFNCHFFGDVGHPPLFSGITMTTTVSSPAPRTMYITISHVMICVTAVTICASFADFPFEEPPTCLLGPYCPRRMLWLKQYYRSPGWTDWIFVLSSTPVSKTRTAKRMLEESVSYHCASLLPVFPRKAETSPVYLRLCSTKYSTWMKPELKTNAHPA